MQASRTYVGRDRLRTRAQILKAGTVGGTQINSIHVPRGGGSQAQYAAAHWAMRPFSEKHSSLRGWPRSGSEAIATNGKWGERGHGDGISRVELTTSCAMKTSMAPTHRRRPPCGFSSASGARNFHEKGARSAEVKCSRKTSRASLKWARTRRCRPCRCFSVSRAIVPW